MKKITPEKTKYNILTELKSLQFLKKNTIKKTKSSSYEKA